MEKQKKSESKKSFEDALAELEEIAEKLEDGTLGLDDSIKEFEKGININLYNQTLAGLEREKVAVLLPKFKIETGLSLKKTLSEMGMPIAFSDAADLSGISGKNDLKISDAFHKAFIEVSEEGTTAAAATAVVIAMKSFVRKTEFIVNRPFIYILKHNGSNTILFMGKVENPNK